MNSRPIFSRIEPLEARIAPALVVQHALGDLVAGPGKTGATINLSKIFDDAALHANRTVVQFTTNFDTDATTPGIQAGVIQIELLDELAPLTVQNFLSYVNNRSARGDYDDTFFHRAERGFVFQGGGYESAGTHPHIPVGPVVHNEFDSMRSNLRGTIAMARIGGEANSATSEFFFNLADNSGLDGVDGGFTVFGDVIQGLDVIDRIVLLPSVKVVRGFNAPVQGYNADPDSNPVTPAPAPTRDQLIRITDAAVVPPTPGNSAGITFSVESITPIGTADSDLVSAKVSGQTLNLKYKPGAVGAVDVVVKGAGNGDTGTDIFRVTVKPNLIADFVRDGLAPAPAPGESGTVQIKLINTAAGLAKGKVDIHFSLAEEVVNPPPMPPSLILPLMKTSLGDVIGKSISIVGGGSLTLSAKVQVPAQLVLDPNKVYRVIAEVVPSAELAANELFADDNVALNGNHHKILNDFGAVNGRANVPVTYMDADGDRVTFTLTGGGTAELIRDSANHVDLHLAGTTPKSRLSATIAKSAAGDGRATLNDISFDAALGTAALGLFDVDGFIAASGGVAALTLGDLGTLTGPTGPGTLVLGAFAPNPLTKAAITLGRVHNHSIESSMPIASLSAVEWIDTTAARSSVLSLGRLAITRGDFQGDLDIGGDAPLASLSVAGFLKNSSITTAGNIGAVVLGGIDHSSLFAGVTARPTALGDFVNSRTLSSFTIKGGAGLTGDLFIESQVAAEKIGAIVVRNVSGAGASDFGFVADAIQSYNRIGGPRLSRLDNPARFTPASEADSVGEHYLVTIL